jgi:hypothetical protein
MSGHSTPPPHPAVDFSRETVLVCILGFISDCCQSHVEIVEVWATGGDHEVSVVRRHESGTATMAANPCRTATAKRTDGTTSLRDDAANAEIPPIPPVP